jgi:hypothetical protein
VSVGEEGWVILEENDRQESGRGRRRQGWRSNIQMSGETINPKQIEIHIMNVITYFSTT